MKRLGEVLVEEGIITLEELKDSLQLQEKSPTPVRLGQILQKKNLVNEVDILKALSILFNLKFLERIEFKKMEEAFRLIPGKLVRKNKIVPFELEKNKISIATCDPSDLHPMDDIRYFLKNFDVEFFVTKEQEILKIIHTQFDETSSTAKEFMNEMEGDLAELVESLENDSIDLTDDAPIIKMVNVILSQAVSERASDIHIEPYEKNVAVRYRVDGILFKVLTPPKSYLAGIVSRIKIMSNLNIAENRLPQDGRIKIRLSGKDIDIRVSTIPCQYGERIVMRLLNKSDQKYSLESMGLPSGLLEKFRKLIYQPHGIILVTGPTGSGKSTTLYCALSELNTSERNIITCEDPVEYQIDGIAQMHMQEKIGLTFATGLRAILRQDPDIVMVGEIRDEETARIAIQASLTGHLVFSTLHTNDAASAVTRLMDMGIEPYLITSSVLGFVAQRLIRVICSNCKTSYKPTSKELNSLELSPKALHKGVFHKGKGCSKCMNTGYKGRTGIYELLVISNDIKKAILEGKDANTINDIALKTGFQTLKSNGIEKIINGITTSEEILRVCQ